jgi:16S rRNA (guanine(966)-N(2))-methyltransferase RsmD
MRIIAGTMKGRRLLGPPPGVRPTADRLRETLFNVVRGRVAGARVLDLFGGTGAVGLEALSRGAVRITFVEQDARAQRVLERNVAACRAENACAIIRGSFPAVFGRIAAAGPFDVVFADPPYETANLDDITQRAATLLAAGGLLVLEHSSRRSAPGSLDGATHVRDLVAGDSALAFYERTTAPAGPA